MKRKLSVQVRFGAFELDVKAGELRSQNRTTLLQEQSFRLLLALIEREGELVTREELQKQLWPNDTLVEFDLGINAAMRRLRRVLGDSPEQPTYIETVARRGYRLIVPVEWLSSVKEAEAGGPTAQNLFAEPGGLIGQRVSHYRVLKRIGAGGMGVVYEAEDLRLGRLAALKFLPEEFAADARALSAFEKEARLASSLNHPNICSIYELGSHDRQQFIAMELLAGGTVRDSFALDAPGAAATARPVPLGKLLDIAIQVCEGLKAAHEKGIVHRDIKPANLFITSSGVVKILDFGLAKLVEADASDGHEDEREVALSADPYELAVLKLSRTGMAIGTAAYMSPEHIRGERLDGRADLFAVGVVLYQMATGTSPFQGGTPAALFNAILHTTPIAPDGLNPGLPVRLGQIVNRALEKDRDLRYQTAAEMAAELRQIASDFRTDYATALKALLSVFEKETLTHPTVLTSPVKQEPGHWLRGLVSDHESQQRSQSGPPHMHFARWIILALIACGTVLGAVAFYRAKRIELAPANIPKTMNKDNIRHYYYIVGLNPAGDNWLALRSEPSFTRGTQMMKMGPDTLMTVLGRDGPWLHVQLRTGEIGWVHSKYLACCK